MSVIDYFNDTVLPQLPSLQVERFFADYLQIRLTSEAGYDRLSHLPVLMLVALTGTGKTTALNALSTRYEDKYDGNRLPSRRHLADFIIIPTAQALAGETIQPITDREQRFHYTRLFSNQVEGGMASIYASLCCRESTVPLISEGIRGHQEIKYALSYCPSWQVMELSLNPVTRLQRLSSREDRFDEAVGTDDLSFLPDNFQDAVREDLTNRQISPKALTIMRAEAQNYSLMPYERTHERYHCLAVDELSPSDIADEIATLLHGMNPDATN